MFFRYWKEDGMPTVVECVDRFRFNKPDDLQYRCLVAGRWEWCKIKYGVDYLQFTVEKD